MLVIDPRPTPRPCAEKNQYLTRRFAARVAKRWRGRLGEPIDEYYCATHGCWHIGHPPGWRAANRQGAA